MFSDSTWKIGVPTMTARFLITLATAFSFLCAVRPANSQHVNRPSQVGAPKKFNLWIGGITGQSYWVEWNGRSLKYQTARYGGPKEPRTTELISPTLEQW